MKRIGTLILRHDVLIKKLATFSKAISGNLSKGAVPAGSKNYYWRVTWKEKQKSKILYVRPEEVSIFRRGIKQFVQLKKVIQEIGDINRTILLRQRTK